MVGFRVFQCSRAVKPATTDMTRVSTTHMHMNVAELPVICVLEEIRPTCRINMTNEQISQQQLSVALQRASILLDHISHNSVSVVRTTFKVYGKR